LGCVAILPMISTVHPFRKSSAPKVGTLPVASESIWPCADFRVSHWRRTELLVKGHTVIEAAHTMGIVEATARTHVANLMSKAGTKRQADLIQLALRLAPPIRAADNGN
jgi:hypothetical protein